MTFPLILIPAAEEDVLEAWDWYLAQSPGLEQKFWDSLQEMLLHIASHPARFPEGMPGIRVAMLKRFPSKIIYRFREKLQRVEIIAVVHHSRNPKVWQERD